MIFGCSYPSLSTFLQITLPLQSYDKKTNKYNGVPTLLNEIICLIRNLYLMNKVIERHLTSITKGNNYDIRLMCDVLKIEIKDLTIAYC